ncbi:unnamed protein product [Dovyalis caffra]|uniref:Protein kinase domain-containing protein n=1 Tax=Dovyalis caffra TaxID=77055 RepID=A0AAV1S0W5_9ROSI|nr:unnamed protein product [Dovyalis caffra]
MVLQFFSLVFFIVHYVTFVGSVNDEGLSLLSFKQSMEDSRYLDNWKSTDLNPCSWYGVTCSREGKVFSVRLPNKGLSGILQLDTGKLVALNHVHLGNNHFFGRLPVELFNTIGLKSLVLSENSFSGPVPDEIGNLKYLQRLDLSQNSFNGSLPSSLIQCKRLKNLVLSRNSFTGSLPDALGTNLVMLQTLNLSHNSFRGSIPGSLGNLSSLQGVLDLSHNLFDGPIPASLGNLPEFVYINLTYNNLSGAIPQNDALVNLGPTAFIGNPLLCGPPLKTQCPPATPPPNMDPKPLAVGDSSGKHGEGKWCLVVIATVAGTMAGICLVGLSFCYWYKKVYGSKESKRTQSCSFEEKSTVRKEMFCFRTDDLESLSETMEQYTFVPLDSKVTFDLDQLLKASAFLVGKSGIGIVYKVVLEKGLTVAVRRLEDGGSQTFKEFQTAVEAIGKIRHPNIVSLLAYCWCINEKLLIYDYVPNGDLATAIHGRTGMTYFKPLSWSIRLRIIKELAKGLAFLHECSPKRYVHGNLKTSNVLLGENMEPLISDFGLSCFAYTSEESLPIQGEQMTSGTSQQGSPYALTPTHSSTPGSCYEAPESSKIIKPSQKWDVYSFGVILLEIISGKSPIMQISLSGMDLVRWIQLSIEVKPPSEALDPFLARDLDKEHEMVAVLKIALACVHASPDKRPSMKNVSENLGRLASLT